VSRRVGILVNARAGAAKHDPGLVQRIAALLPEGRVQLTSSAEEIPPALDRLRAQEIDLLVLVGGDGTVGGSLTQLLEHWPAEARPAVALAPGGTVNTSAKSLGAREGPEAYLRRLLEARTHDESPRPLVRVRAEGEAAGSGMIFAMGAAVRFLELYYGETGLGVRGAATIVGRVLASLAVGGPLARRFFSPVPVSIEVDGELLDVDRFTVIGASSVRDIGLGFRPFHTAGSDPSRFHLLVSDAGTARLAVELPALRLGLDSPGSCLRHHSARQVSLRFLEPQPWSIDADLHPPARSLEIQATEAIRFVTS